MISKVSPRYKYVSDEIPAMTDHPVISEKYLRLSAIVAMLNGMSPKEALKAITINPAETIGLGDRVGSLEVGKDADMVILSDNPLKVKSKVEMVFINGEIAYESG